MGECRQTTAFILSRGVMGDKMTEEVATTAAIIRLLENEKRSKMIKQGAEAKVYVADLFPNAERIGEPSGAFSRLKVEDEASQGTNEVLIKYRFPKKYRHPTLSAQLTALRTTAEARALVRCGRAGVNTPKIVCVDEQQGVLGLELIDGHSVRELLGGGAEGEDGDERETISVTFELLTDEEAMKVMRMIGVQIGRMHQAHIIHGDLTTSNMMIRRRKGIATGAIEVVMIDFGLSSNSTSSEDKAVDLYVLERAFASTHPSSEHLYAEVMRAYEDTLVNDAVPYDARIKAEKGTVTGPTSWLDIKRKFDEVRLRGRKRSMVG